MSNAKYFGTTRRGEIPELKAELLSTDKKTKVAAMKKVIANMTLGNDMSALFPEVLGLMQTPILELKKMVYHYVITYAKLKPELALLCVNSFIRDANDLNPLIRGLALRTMGYIHVDKITEALTEPLRKCLKDEDPYVRKTAAINVVKLFDHEVDLVRDEGYLERLREMLTDAVPMVVANAMAALTEIANTSDEEIHMDFTLVNKLLAAVNESSEWGQVYLLEALCMYKPADASEAETIAERMAPRLMHANSAVTLAAVRLIMHVMPYFSREEVRKAYARKLSPPLVTLLCSDKPEVKYVALRNVLLLIQKRPDILQDEMKVFFCEYNDPIYVKLAKLEVMVRKANAANVELVLSELKEYATEVDVDFVRKSVRAIGICAVKIERAADRCIDVLLELIQTKVSYVVQEAVVVIKDIFRKYPNRYEKIIGTLCENLETLDEPEAKASMVWIIGQYADRIDNADELLEIFLATFLEEPVDVQLALLTASVKLFLKRPNLGENIIKRVFKWVTEDVDNPDLRDRGFIYWRLLSADPMAAKAIVLSDKPLGSTAAFNNLEPQLLDELLGHIGSLASVYHKPPSAFGLATKSAPQPTVQATSTATPAAGGVDPQRESATDIAARQGGVMPGDSLYGGSAGYDATGAAPRAAGVSVAGAGGGVMNLLDLDEDELAYVTPGAAAAAAAGPGAAPAGGLGSLYGTDVAQLGGANVNSAQGLASALGDLNLGYGAPAGSGDYVVASGYSAAGGVDGGISEVFASEQRVVLPKKVLLPASAAKGLEIHGTFARRAGKIFLEVTFTNRALQPMSDFAFQFNTNTFGITPVGALQVRSPLPPNQSADTALQLAPASIPTRRDPINLLQIAVKNNVGIFYFQTTLPLHILFADEPSLERSEYPRLWTEIPDQNEFAHEVGGLHFSSVEFVRNKLTLNNVFVMADRKVDETTRLYCVVRIQPDKALMLTEIKLDDSLQSAVIATKTMATHLVPAYHEALTAILRHGL